MLEVVLVTRDKTEKKPVMKIAPTSIVEIATVSRNLAENYTISVPYFSYLGLEDFREIYGCEATLKIVPDSMGLFVNMGSLTETNYIYYFAGRPAC